MIGIDTNVLLRFLMTDDPRQNQSAVAFFRSRSAADPAYISTFVFAEACWVLSRSYGFKNHEIATLFEGLMASREIVFEDSDVIKGVFSSDEFAKIDIADVLIAGFAKQAGCEKIVTFDRKAASLIPGMELLA
ncbi:MULTISPECIES: PIN domain-containing protein [unclassified Rhizobium]|uniref:PIN domain-containing protein n=1 Tax=Rhizobium sp. PP-CC-3G-465 TaxID=2135648 RepID=UPI0010E9CD67|nr:putative nucleic-acid-binding protein [Rhizobium sp. PP-F2F-G36]TCQ21769.1 putative nucleic-acid-binding protein [Rhizobium sp. PP-CC-3G-465]